MIDIEKERIIPLRDVAKHVPSRCSGKRLSPATIWRWATKKNNPLETLKISGGRYTSIEAIARFIDRGTTPLSAIEKTNATKPTGGPTDRSVAAGEELKKLIDPRGGQGA